MRRKEKAKIVLERLAKVILVPETELQYQNPFQLLVAVMLSAQCTDKRVNETTPALFQRFPSPESLLEVEFDEVFPYLKSISYPANKTKHLLQTAKLLHAEYGGEVPKEFEELIKLPGVGRKTANVITSVLWREPRFAVDTHVYRVARRIGLSLGKTVLKVEQDLMEIFPKETIPDAHHYLILHGRYTCVARSPKCAECPLTDICKDFSRRQKAANRKSQG